jgi:threonine synthase
MNNSPLLYADKISNHFKKNIWLKLEILNPTGSHKDRESIKLINEAKKKNFKSIGCASTGNLAISIAFFSKIYNLRSKIWLRKQDININNLNLIKSLGGKVFIRNTSNLSELYDLSSILMKKNKIFNANPNNSKMKYFANTEIVKEIYKINKKINTFISCVNNGSHIIGLKKGLKDNHKIYGVFSKSKLATSINSFTKYEYKNIIKYFNFDKDFIEAKDEDILKGYKLLALEGLTCEPSSASIIGSIGKLKEKNICCIITGSIHKNLIQLQNILS